MRFGTLVLLQMRRWRIVLGPLAWVGLLLASAACLITSSLAVQVGCGVVVGISAAVLIELVVGPLWRPRVNWEQFERDFGNYVAGGEASGTRIRNEPEHRDPDEG